MIWLGIAIGALAASVIYFSLLVWANNGLRTRELSGIDMMLVFHQRSSAALERIADDLHEWVAKGGSDE